MARIGFIGLGHMGLPMAMHLLKQGHEVMGYDKQPDGVHALMTQGGRVAEDLIQLAVDKDVVITMLQTGAQLHQVCLDKAGLFTHMSKKTCLIDCSTVGIEAIQVIHQKADQLEIPCLDAPVSGGVAGAKAGILTLMVGGDFALFEAMKPILSAFSKKLIYTGKACSGQAAKLCNNMVLGASMIAISEAFVLAEKLGLTPEKLFEVVSQSSGNCWALTHHTPYAGLVDAAPANTGFQPGFSSAMMLKDLRLSQDAAQSVGVKTAMGRLASEIYQGAIEDIGSLDFSAIIQSLSNK